MPNARQAARSIKLDKSAIKRLVDQDLLPDITQWLERQDQDKPIGTKRGIANTTLMVTPVGNRGDLEATIRVVAGRATSDKYAVLGGSAELLPFDILEDDHRKVNVQIVINSLLTAAQFLERMSTSSDKTHVPYGLYSVLIHELTHVAEMPFMRVSPYDVGQNADSDWAPKDLDAYANSPIEVRAFMQQIVDEALIWAKRRVIRMQANGTNNGLIAQVLKYSATWKSMQARWDATSRKKILGAVYDALEKAGLLFT